MYIRALPSRLQLAAIPIGTYDGDMSEQQGPSAADRLLDAASRLFYTRGVPNVGINEIIARAGVARMTLYHHFPSKDALLKAVLERRRAERSVWLQRATSCSDEPLEQLLAVFELLVEWAETPDFRGCPLVAATVELGGQLNVARPYAQAHHEATTAFFAERARGAGLQRPDDLAAALLVLIEGAAIACLVRGSAQPAQTALTAARTLVGAHG